MRNMSTAEQQKLIEFLEANEWTCDDVLDLIDKDVRARARGVRQRAFATRAKEAAKAAQKAGILDENFNIIKQG